VELGKLPVVRRFAGGGRRNVLAYWAALAGLLLLAGVPVAILSATAPSSQVEDGGGLSAISQTVRRSGPTYPIDSLTPSPAGSGNPQSPGSPAPSRGVDVAPGRSSSAQAPSTQAPANLDAGFGIQCWPDLDVVPGGSATVECNIPLLHGFTGEIGLSCQVAGMSCSLSPNPVMAVADRSAMTTRLTVTAPDASPVGMVLASVSATGGETGSAMKTTDVRVNVPAPFLVRCESVGASFVKGEEAAMKCWISFHGGFQDAVAVTVLDAAGIPVALDTATMAAAPNQTRAFNLQFDTAALAAGVHQVKVGVSSNRYLQEAAAVFSVVPAG
jgi:hypothetical protein